MKKMKLEMDALSVESFETADVEEQAGTVHGNAQTEWNTCPGYGPTCDGGDTCWDSCGGACDTHYCTPNTCSVYCLNPSNLPYTDSPTCRGLYTCAPQCP
ncbi:MAG TPA: pinensin family lanthipeptide [Longimicrobium sp.]|nr:pinensin family lanthipeptide [Longimicrobium sp.]